MVCPRYLKRLSLVPLFRWRFESRPQAKAYLKEGRALRVETTVNNASDFALHKTLTAENWTALRRTGAATNARFLAALGEDLRGNYPRD
jgi:hypothetical protein